MRISQKKEEILEELLEDFMKNKKQWETAKRNLVKYIEESWIYSEEIEKLIIRFLGEYD